MESLDTFIQLPLQLDPSTKAISTTHPTSALTTELAHLNSLHRSLQKDVDPSFPGPPGVPPPPMPIPPKRSAQITKLRESGNAAFKRGAPDEAIRLYGLAIDMAASRPVWEAAGLVREELSALYGNRAQARMSAALGQKDWAGASVDAECSVELKKVGNVKGWWRRGKALMEMGRLEEAREWIREGIEFESQGPDREGVKELEGLERELKGKLGLV